MIKVALLLSSLMRHLLSFVIMVLLFTYVYLKTAIKQPLISKISEPFIIAEFNDSIKKTWIYKDIKTDSIAGLSLEKVYELLSHKKKGKEVIVAILDSEIDIKHSLISDNLWINTKEIKNNGIDDDNNGYVDDINGWNFLGNNKGENIIHANLEYVRIVRKYKNDFENKKIEDFVNLEDKQRFINYSNAKKSLDKKIKRAKSNYDNAQKVFRKYQDAKNALKSYFPDGNYLKTKLDDIKTNNPELGSHTDYMVQVLKYKETDESIAKKMKEFNDILFKRANIEFNERTILDEKTEIVNDRGYGNNILNGNLEQYTHGTQIAGLVVDKNIKIMPLCISPYGNEHDKDIAVAIHYAVDNGAEVINMSFSKNFSMYNNWVLDAIKYAEKNNVLIVTSAGNDGKNINEIDNFPDDVDTNGNEVSNNFLTVGATTASANENLIAKYSNYGNIKVDVFATGDKVYTTIPNNDFTFASGTSLAAALTSKVAALLFSHYPNLTASQVKHIIMDSGVAYTFPVKTPTREDKDKTTPFNELSKSGKVVNAYNALILADRISRQKN